MAGFHNLDEFYAVNSSCNYINQVTSFCSFCYCLFSLFWYSYRFLLRVFSSQIKIPVFLLNASDDPLIPEELFDTPYNHVSKYLVFGPLIGDKEFYYMVLTGTLYAATKGTFYEALFLNRICSFTSWGRSSNKAPPIRRGAALEEIL